MCSFIRLWCERCQKMCSHERCERKNYWIVICQNCSWRREERRV